MIRRTILIVSLLLLGATAVLWTRSHFYMESILWGYPAGQRQVSSDSGTLFFCDSWNPVPASTGLAPTYARCRPDGWKWFEHTEDTLKLLGFLYVTRTPFQRNFMIGVPHWAVCVLLSLPLLVGIVRTRRSRRRRTRGMCVKCGYNLTGNVSGVCPECGEKI